MFEHHLPINLLGGEENEEVSCKYAYLAVFKLVGL